MPHVLETVFEVIEGSNPNGSPRIRGYNIINGRLTEAKDGGTFESRNPAWLDDCLGEFPLSGKDDVHAALHAARDAFPGWAATPAPTRGQIIGNMGRLLMEYKDDIVRVETREIGKTLKESAGSVQEAIDTCLFFQSEGRRLYGQTVNSELPDKELFTYRRPLGVCGIINACNAFVGFSYWWGGGRLKVGGKDYGKCYSPTYSGHKGSYGADCSGFVAKVWQLSAAMPFDKNLHPYSTYHFYNHKSHWSHISRGSTKRADAMVYRSGSGGHVLIYEKGDVWGSAWTYEARGCSYGVVHNLRSVSSSYRARRRSGI